MSDQVVVVPPVSSMLNDTEKRSALSTLFSVRCASLLDDKLPVVPALNFSIPRIRVLLKHGPEHNDQCNVET